MRSREAWIVGVARSGLWPDLHFLDQVFGTVDFAGDPKNETHIDSDRTAVPLVPREVIDGGFEGPIEVHPDQFSAGVEDWTPRVSAGGIGAVEERHRDCS